LRLGDLMNFWNKPSRLTQAALSPADNATAVRSIARFGKSAVARTWPLGLAAGLMLTCSPAALRADPSVTIQDLAAEIQALRAENREMKAAIATMKGETRRTQEKVRQVVERPVPVPAPANAAPIPPGALPAFVTADKKLVFGGITLSPGGFLAGESVFRSKTTNSDINSAWASIPLGNNPLSGTNEYRLTGRQSRAALLAEGFVTPSTLASGYGEFDFLGAGTTSNATDTNSYAPRIRQLYAAVDWNDIGVHLAAGQMWSLTTLNSKGITLRNEVPPPTIDGQFLPGFIFARQAGVRLTKDFDRKLWFSLALEEAQTTFPGGATAACQGTAATLGAGASAVPIAVSPAVTAICAGTASGAGFSQYGQPYSLNHAPDVIGKVAYEANLGDRDIHLEAMGIYKDLYDASFPTGSLGTLSTHDTAGFGFGGGLIVPIIPKLLDLQGSAMAGRGIGRYGAGLLPDATLNPDGSLRPIGEVIGMAGLTLHATPQLDIYAFAGIEKENPAYGVVPTAAGGVTFFGYGTPNALNSGCSIMNAAAATCSGQTQTVWQVTAGFWDKVYSGSYGEVRVGVQYSLSARDIFQTQYNGALVAGSGQTLAQEQLIYSPKTYENTIMTSIRYYPFAAPPVAPALVAKY
jgi:hypothetical protein